MFVDTAIARRLELASIWRSIRYASAKARIEPDIPLAIEAVGDGFVVFAGVEAPVNAAGGLGMTTPVARHTLDAVDEFFRSRGLRPRVMLCPLADSSLLFLLRERHYSIDTFFSVLVLPLDRPLNRKLNGDVLVRRIDESEAETWLRAVGGGFDGDSSLATEMRTILAPNFYSESAAILLAEIDGQAVGGGAMYVHDGVVELGSTSTLPPYRRRGVQTALLDARLKLAQEMGCDLAMVITSPGTASQRNVMRLGFEMAYTKVAMRGKGVKG